MHRTLLLCFIHGFKGDDDTFGGFPRHLQATLTYALPNISVRAVVYPKYETRGDLQECVSRFREWLQNQVIDIEVEAGTPSPTIDPSVHVVLVGHSMGGIVAAETVLSIVSDEPIKSPSASMTAEPNAFSARGNETQSDSAMDGEDVATDKAKASTISPSPTFMFPYITGILAFDTPFLGISPGVLAYGAETHYRSASTAYNMVSSAANAFGWGKGSPASAASAGSRASSATKAITAGPGAGSLSAEAAMNAAEDAAAVPAWQRWGKMAMFAGAAGAVIASGAAAYVNMGAVKEGWTWVGSHLEFVNCLVRGEALKSRVGSVVELTQTRGTGFANMVTVLGKGAGRTEGISVAGGWVEVGGSKGSQEAVGRTFCALPRREDWQPFFESAVNDKVANEIEAHVAMFFPRDNPGYYELAERAKARIVEWVDKGWYGGSEPSDKKQTWDERLSTDEDPVMVD